MSMASNRSSSKYKDRTGELYGRWLVISYAGPDKRGDATWLCECQCPKKTRRVVSAKRLKTGKSLSCGCLKKERLSKRATHGFTRTGLKQPPEYQSWTHMIQRCT